MNCPSCGTNSYCKETRQVEKYTRRRRECPTCGDRFTTREYFQEDLAIIAEETKMLREFYEAHKGRRPEPESRSGDEKAEGRFNRRRQPLERVFTGLKKHAA
jgi:transcriptional regulator NrdR family protein